MNKTRSLSSPSRPSRATPCRPLWLAAAAALLTGCASSPIMRIEAPGYSVAQSPVPSGTPKNMAEAVAKLDFFRATYYEAIVNRAQAQQNTTIGLVWLGTAVAAMAAGTVHRDAILGATLIGGTTYGLSRVQLDARHVLVWNQGIKALNCAKEASLPMDIGSEQYDALSMANKDLTLRRAAVASLRAQTAATASLVQTVDAELAAKAFELLTKVDDILMEADRTAGAAGALLQLASGAELTVTVDKIHAKVTEAMSNLLVDVSAVPQLVAGLGGFASAFAPGVDVGALLSKANKRIGEVTTQALSGDENMKKLAQQMESLKSVMALLSVEQQRVSAMLVPVDRAAVLAALKACDVAGVSTAMVLRPATLQFVVGTAGAKGFQISGGKAPYSVVMLDAQPDWLTRDFDGGSLADTAKIRVTDKAVPGSYNVLVSDSSPTKNSQILTVSIGPKPGPQDPAPEKNDDGSSGGNTTSTGTNKSNFEALAKAIAAKWKTSPMEVRGLKLLVTKADVVNDGKAINVAFTCDKRQAAGWPNATDRKEIAEQFSLAANATPTALSASNALKASKALDAKFSQIKPLRDPSTCLPSAP